MEKFDNNLNKKKPLTVDEMIAALQEASARGYGDCHIVGHNDSYSAVTGLSLVYETYKVPEDEDDSFLEDVAADYHFRLEF